MKWYTLFFTLTYLLSTQVIAADQSDEMKYILSAMNDLGAYEMPATELAESDDKDQAEDDLNPLELDQVTMGQSATNDFVNTDYDSEEMIELKARASEKNNSRSPAIVGIPEPIPTFDYYDLID